MLTYNFISKENEINLTKYQYKGRDNSILYNYVFGPIAESCLKYLPPWVSPNTLTLCGYLCVMIPHLILWYFFPNELNGDVPRLLCAFIGIMHLIYMNFDNVDGKQARKTGNSSPLGLLFDHGCDALVVSVQGISLATCMGFGNTYSSYLVYASGAIPFFITTVDEYYTDFMYLPWINGASEGCLAVGLFILVSGAFGPEWWGEKAFLGESKRQITLYIFLLGGLATSLNIYRRMINSKGMKVLKQAMFDSLFSWFLHGTMTYIFLFSPSQVGEKSARILIYISGLHWAKQCTILQACHVSGQKYNQLSKTSFALISSLLINTVIGNITGECPIDENTLIYCVWIVSIFIYAHMTISITNQFCRVLNIRAFKVKDVANKKALD